MGRGRSPHPRPWKEMQETNCDKGKEEWLKKKCLSIQGSSGSYTASFSLFLEKNVLMLFRQDVMPKS